MTAVFAALILIVSPAALFAIQRMRARSGLIWLAAALTAGIGWVLVLTLSWQLPVEIPWPVWGEIQGLYGGPVWFLVDGVSWSLGLAVCTLAFASVLASLADSSPPQVWELSGILFFAGVGLTAVFAGSVAALLLAWTASDLTELAVLLGQVRNRRESERVVVALSGNLMGSLFFLLGAALTRQPDFSLTAIPGGAGVWMILAAGFRLGVLPAQPPFLPSRALPSDLGALVRLAPAASAVVLLARAAAGSVQSNGAIILLVFAGLSAIYGAVNWLVLQDLYGARPFWRIGVSSLAAAAALLALPGAVIAWGHTLIFGGGLVFLSGAVGGGLFWLFALASLLMFGLPYTPSWEASLLVTDGGLIWGGLTIIAAVLLLAGYLEKMKAGEPAPGEPVRGVRALGIAGPVLITASFMFAGLAPIVLGDLPQGSWWVGFLVAGLTYLGGRLITAQDLRRLLPEGEVRPLLNLAVLYRAVWRLYRLTARAVVFLTRILEGRSAILWAILLLALLVTLIAQTGLGA